jgi:hypothetical protein
MHRFLSNACDGEIMGNMELVRCRIEQPVADLTVLLGAMKLLLRRGPCRQEQDKK